ncbi:MAG: hypothetical protein NT030_06540 [Candidatus Saganbacteria bacterium]|nr:hypothetical protein [Candidatus Saganbacteria bacterium]
MFVCKIQKSDKYYHVWHKYEKNSQDFSELYIEDRKRLSSILERYFPISRNFYDFLADNELLLLFDENDFIGLAFDWYKKSEPDVDSNLPSDLIKIIKRWGKPEGMEWEDYKKIRQEASGKLANFICGFIEKFKQYLNDPVLTFIPQSSRRSTFQPWDNVAYLVNLKRPCDVKVWLNIIASKEQSKKQIDCATREESLSNISGKFIFNPFNLRLIFGLYNFSDKQVIIFDDMCGYGGTFLDSLRLIRSKAPKSFCFAVAKDNTRF